MHDASHARRCRVRAVYALVHPRLVIGPDCAAVRDAARAAQDLADAPRSVADGLLTVGRNCVVGAGVMGRFAPATMGPGRERAPQSDGVLAPPLDARSTPRVPETVHPFRQPTRHARRVRRPAARRRARARAR